MRSNDAVTDLPTRIRNIDSDLNTEVTSSIERSKDSFDTNSTFTLATASHSRVDDIIDLDTARPPVEVDLLGLLAQSFKPIVNTTRYPSSSSSQKYHQTAALSASTTTGSQQMSSALTSLTSSSGKAEPGKPWMYQTSEKAQQTSHASIDINGPRKREINPESDVALSLLDPVSNLVADVAGLKTELSAALTDAMLAVLPVDPDAITSIVSSVAEQTSVSAEEVIPYILPALSRAWGTPANAPTPSRPPPRSLNETLKSVIAQGSIVVNQIVTASALIEAPIMGDVLNQVADIMYAVAYYFKEAICAVGRNDNAILRLEALIPCKSASIGSASGNILTLNPFNRTSQDSALATASWNIIPSANPSAYDILSNVLPSAYSPAPEPTVMESVSTTCTSSSQPSIVEQSVTCATETSSSSVTITATSEPCLTPTMPMTPEPSPKTGPCPERGYHCSDCLNGWFCPPQETPPQAVPCGLGWPCFHCTGGYFCSSTASSVPTSCASGTSGTSTPPDSTEAASISCSAPTASAEHTRSFGVAVPGWTYLGCFQDAISRTLVGSTPVDYLRGQMSNLTCINHCNASGYSFAGTEYGSECWCGSSIQDKAVRLPESSCDVPCQYSGDEFCGGSWAISVFRCSEAVDEAASGGASVQSSSPLPAVTSPPRYQQTVPLYAMSHATSESSLPGRVSEGVQTSSLTTRGPVAQLLAEARHS